jgi:hypothetical protein
MALSPGLQVLPNSNLVCKLNRPLYDLKQSSRTWYLQLDLFLQSFSFTKSIANTDIYINKEQNKFIILAIYIDDTLLISNDSIGLL